ncbi:MAG: pentapeptide repeat-containing protein [Ignavibacteriales bacterium]|nr:pentapeptide repeat-containing protein [Ignavibacteriales bacterium]
MGNKDELVQLLRSGNIEEFNSSRPFEEGVLLDLTEIDLRGCEIAGANLSFTDLSGSALNECEITEVDLTGCDLSAVDFSSSVIKNVDFIKATLAGTKFNNSKVNECDFAEADLSGTDFSDADLSNSEFTLSENILECISAVTQYGLKLIICLRSFEPEYLDDLASLKDDDDDVLEGDFCMLDFLRKENG